MSMERYDKYKPSGIDWIGEVPEHWDIRRARFISQLWHGMSYTPKDIVSEDDGVLVLRASNIQDNQFAFDDNVYILKDRIPEIKMIKKGDIVICSTNGSLALVGKSALAKKDMGCSFGSFMMVMRTMQNPTFIQYQLSQMVDLYRGLFSTTTINQLTMDMLNDFSFILPSLDEQEAIAAYLDERCGDIDKVVATQEKRIELLKELKQSEITKAVTRGLNPDVAMKDSGVEWIGMVPEHWEVWRIKFISKDEKYSIKTGPFGTQLKGEDLKEEGPVCVYNQRNVIDDDFSITNFYVTEEKAKSLDSFYTKPEDLLITSRGTIGRCAIMPKDCVMGLLHPCLIALRVDKAICDNEWMKFFINETDCFSTNVKLNSNATTIDVIYTDTLKNIEVPVPPLYEQKMILENLNSRCSDFDLQISNVKKQIDLLREYKQSLITEVVTGKRKVC